MVYVDNFRAPYRNMIMCHMIADTRSELLEMVDKIGVQRKWIQGFGTAREHFDISLAKKKLAIRYGAKEINMRELARMTSERDFKTYAMDWILISKFDTADNDGRYYFRRTDGTFVESTFGELDFEPTHFATLDTIF